MDTLSKEELVLVGILGRPHGVRGQIRCHPETHDLERHRLLKQVYVQKGNSFFKLHVESSSAAKNFWLLKFKEYSSPESVAELTHGELLIDSEERLPAPEGEYYFSDLQGFSILSESGTKLAEVIDCLELPSVNAFQIRFEKEYQSEFTKEQILIPWIDDCILEINEDSQSITCNTNFLKSLCPEKGEQ